MPNKMSYSEYVSKVAATLTEAYGDTLPDYDTDISLAKAVVKELRPFLFFRKESSKSRRKFLAWKKDRVPEEDT